MLVSACFAAAGNQPAWHHQQFNPREEVWFWSVWCPAGRLSGVLRHIRWVCLQTVYDLKCTLELVSSVFVSVVYSQICPAPPQVHMGRNSMFSDQRSISRPLRYFLLTSFKSFLTRTPIYLSVSTTVYSRQLFCYSAYFSFSVICLFSVTLPCCLNPTTSCWTIFMLFQ